MPQTCLCDASLAIWKAGVEAVTPRRLFADKVVLSGNHLFIDDLDVNLTAVRRLVIVGAGKASAAMAIELERQILSQFAGHLANIKIEGWINCPADSFTTQPPHIHLHAARPAGSNSPTQAAIQGTQRILELVSSCDQSDIVICLISGGGSALLVAPRAGVSLEDKQAVTSVIAAAGGNIEQLNNVRRALSQVKGGGLARACTAGRLISLVISDVLGDPLDIIASGPTRNTVEATSSLALKTLTDLRLMDEPRLANVVAFLQSSRNAPRAQQVTASCEHVILGNNADAVDAAGVKAVELGYRYVMQASRQPEGDVLLVAQSAAAAALQVMSQDQIDCWISGGEPTVTLPSNNCGKGGRNQQLALAVLEQLSTHGWPFISNLRDFAFLSGGTDGEDGPTDAAGACFDSRTWHRMRQLKIAPSDSLARADAYHFFEQLGGLIHTGPTGTNVCDLRVGLAAPRRVP